MTSRELVLNDGRILYRFVAACIFGLIGIGLLAFSWNDQTIGYIGLTMLVAGLIFFLSGRSNLVRNRYLLLHGSQGKATVQDIYTERASYMIKYTYQIEGVNYKKSEPTFFVDRYKEGEEADIIFDSEKPGHVILSEKVRA